MAAGVGIAPTSRALQARAHLSMPSSERWCVREELQLRCSPHGSGFTDRSDTAVSRLTREKSLRQDLHPHWSVPKTDASSVGLRRVKSGAAPGTCALLCRLRSDCIAVYACAAIVGEWSGWQDSHRRSVAAAAALAASLPPERLVPARGNAPRSAGYQPDALLLSYAGMAEGGGHAPQAPGGARSH